MSGDVNGGVVVNESSKKPTSKFLKVLEVSTKIIGLLGTIGALIFQIVNFFTSEGK